MQTYVQGIGPKLESGSVGISGSPGKIGRFRSFFFIKTKKNESETHHFSGDFSSKRAKWSVFRSSVCMCWHNVT